MTNRKDAEARARAYELLAQVDEAHCQGRLIDTLDRREIDGLADAMLTLASKVQRGAIERAAKVLDDLATAEDVAIAHLDEPADRVRRAIIAAEFRRGAKGIRALGDPVEGEGR